MSAAEQMAKEVQTLALEEPQADHLASSHPHKDLSIKEGEKIHVSVKIPKKTATSTSSKPSSTGGLRPPPPAGSLVKPQEHATPSATSSDISFANFPSPESTTQTPQGESVDDDWGDFTSS